MKPHTSYYVYEIHELCASIQIGGGAAAAVVAAATFKVEKKDEKWNPTENGNSELCGYDECFTVDFTVFSSILLPFELDCVAFFCCCVAVRHIHARVHSR